MSLGIFTLPVKQQSNVCKMRIRDAVRRELSCRFQAKDW